MKRHLVIILVLISILLLFVGCNNQGPNEPVYQLHVNVAGQGTVLPNSGSFKLGTTITLQVQAAAGWKFDAWSGQNYQDLIQSGASWRLMMNSDKFLTAVFVKEKEGDIPAPDLWQLTVELLGEGSIVPQTGAFVDGTRVSLQVLPASGWSFSQWSGLHAAEVYYDDNAWQLLMNGNKNILAIFVEEERPSFNLHIDIIGQGTVEERLMSKSGDYPENSLVRLLAKAKEGWVFQEWLGDVNGEESLVYLDMDRDKRVTAVFQAKNYNLDIRVVGEGIVDEQLLAGEYPYYSIVKLTARPAYGWKFVEWRGDLKSQKAQVQIEIDGDKEVTAVFQAQEVYLDLKIIGKGKVEEKLITDLYDPGSIVRLTAIADEGWEFNEWRGDARGSREVIEIDMDSDKEIIAVFALKEEEEAFKIDISIIGNGHVEENLIREYPSGSLVRLTARADQGWKFVEWRGDLSGTETEAELEMNEDKVVEAVFREKTTGTARVSGQLTMAHLWPNPYQQKGREVPKAKKDLIGKILALQHAEDYLTVRGREKYYPGQLLVVFKEGYLMAKEEMNILASAGLRIKVNLSAINAYAVEVPDALDEASIFKAIERISDQLSQLSSNIACVKPSYYVYALDNDVKLPNDESYGRQWHYPQIRLPQAWSVCTGSRAVRIAVLDTGVDVGHPDLNANFDTAAGWNFHNNDEDFTDRMGHGSHCAGTIAANTNNGLGVAGVMWEASIIPVKVLGDNGSGSDANVAAGILYVAGLGEKAISSPAQVISMSMGSDVPDSILGAACDRASQEGLILFAAAGNEKGPICWPAAYSSVICVGATDYNYPQVPQMASYSNFGPEMGLVAPGGNFLTDSDRDGYGDGVYSPSVHWGEYIYSYKQGTSMSCPHAAGVAGLMLANGVPQNEIKEALFNTAIDLGTAGFDNYFGHGLINAYWAVNNVKEIKIVVGTKIGNTIDEVARGTVDLKSKSYSLDNIPEGEYQVFGWIDVRASNTLDLGDYFFASEKIVFRNNDCHSVDINLEEIR